MALPVILCKEMVSLFNRSSKVLMHFVWRFWFKHKNLKILVSIFETKKAKKTNVFFRCLSLSYLSASKTGQEMILFVCVCFLFLFFLLTLDRHIINSLKVFGEVKGKEKMAENFHTCVMISLFEFRCFLFFLLYPP